MSLLFTLKNMTHNTLKIISTIAGIFLTVVTIIFLIKGSDVNVNITVPEPKKVEDILKPQVEIPLSKKNIPLNKKHIIEKSSFAEIESFVIGLTSIVFDVKVSSINLETKYRDIDSPGAAGLMGIRFVDLLIRLEDAYNCKVEDDIAEKLLTIKETVVMFFSCQNS